MALEDRGRGWWTRHEFSLLLAILVAIVAITLLDPQHNYWNQAGRSAVEIQRQTSMLGIFALGAAVVVIAGGIDLSQGAVIAFSGTICATTLVLLAPEEMRSAKPLAGWVLVVGVGASLLSGLLIGTLHAWLITVIRLPPFVATLSTLVGLRSLGRILCENVTAANLGGRSTQIQIYDKGFRELGRDPQIPFLLFVVLALFIWVLLSRTVVGRHIHALGGNEAAARLSGIRTDRVKWLAYTISAVLASLAGVLYICDQSVADPQTLGRGYELNAIAAAVVGGCSLAGGVGTIPGTVLGALFLRVVIDGVAKIIKTGADVYEGLIVGGVVILAVAFTQTASGGGRLRRFFVGPLGWAMLGVIAVGGAVAAAVWLPTRSSPAHGWYAVAAGLALAGALGGLDRARAGWTTTTRR
jgi:ribose/xylose/arabinose/galactoside ABC-type transport system permease subunit